MKLHNFKYNHKCLTGDHPHVHEQLQLTETTDTIREEEIFLAEKRLGVSTLTALSAARSWLDRQDKDDNETK